MNVVRKVCRVDGFSYAALLPCRECTRDPYVLVASSVWARATKLVEVGVSLFQGSSRTAIPLAIIATMRGYSLLISTRQFDNTILADTINKGENERLLRPSVSSRTLISEERGRWMLR